MTIRTVAEHGQSACHRLSTRPASQPASIAGIVDWAQLRPAYDSFAALESAWAPAPCRLFCYRVNARPHPVTRRAPAEMLAEETARLHPLPEYPYTAALRG